MIMKTRTITPAQTPEELLQDLRNVVSEAEKMLAAPVAEHTEAEVSALRAKLANAQERFADLYEGAKRKVIAGAKYTDETIRTYPYQSIAVALGLGVVLGVVLGRRSK
jgi:ElaB/YqjD/DUF883 family membrane-anchored ribosome-binding protein